MRKTVDIVRKVVAIILIVLALAMMIFTIISSVVLNRNDRSIFGYKAFIVTSDSMSKTDFSAGDLIFVTNVDPKTLVEGDIITYQSTNKDNYGETVTHKIRSLTVDSEGNPGFITYGTTTDTNDENVVVYSFVLGKYTGRLPKVGHFFQFLKTVPGYIVCILIPFLLLILSRVWDSIVIFRKYKKEQLAEIQAEKDTLAAERAETQKMMEEMKALKEQLSNSVKPEPENKDDNNTEQKEE